MSAMVACDAAVMCNHFTKQTPKMRAEFASCSKYVFGVEVTLKY